MADNAPEGGNPLSRIPKPVLIIGGVVLAFFGYRYYQARKQNQSSSGSSAGPTASPYGAPLSGGGTVPVVIPIQSGAAGSSSAATSNSTAGSWTPQQAANDATSALYKWWQSIGFNRLGPGSQSGSGFFYPGLQTSQSGQSYAPAPSWPAAQAYESSGGTAYYEPTPGVFTPVGQNTQLAPGTPLYLPLGGMGF